MVAENHPGHRPYLPPRVLLINPVVPRGAESSPSGYRTTTTGKAGYFAGPKGSVSGLGFSDFFLGGGTLPRAGVGMT